MKEIQTINQSKEHSGLDPTGDGEQRMTSLDIAAVTGKAHKDVLKAIRNMEPAWERECERKFALTSEKIQMPQGGVRLIPVFSLTKEESLYVATKFNDDARARLVKRWYQLECERLGVKPKALLRTGRREEGTEVPGVDSRRHGIHQDDCVISSNKV